MMPNHPFHPYIGDFSLTGILEEDVKAFFYQHKLDHTYRHVRGVAQKADELANRFGADRDKCRIGGWLHDISNVVPNAERVALAHALGVEVLPSEAGFPMILHQKLSVVVARDLFGVDDADILSAIGCHTTLKAGASLCDHVVFLADKIAWDQAGSPPYLADLLAALDKSIEAASLVYINYLWAMRDKLRVVHPWLVEARGELVGNW